jgi:hypothetical protein
MMGNSFHVKETKPHGFDLQFSHSYSSSVVEMLTLQLETLAFCFWVTLDDWGHSSISTILL